MKLDKIDTKIGGHAEKDSLTKVDLEKNFSESSDPELIEKEYKALLKMIENFVKENFLKKDFYKNLPDGSNPEIDNICNYSASDIEKRIQEGKGIFYMNPCISQTIYSVNKLKKEFSNLSNYINLGIEFLQFMESGIPSAHAFIEIKIPTQEPTIVDYARNNDVYIYQGSYLNRTNNVKSLNIIIIPSNCFDENDNIFQIAKKSGKIPHSMVDQIQLMLENRIKHLCKDNSVDGKFDKWVEEHGNSPKFYKKISTN